MRDLNRRELAAVLTGLRLLQQFLGAGPGLSNDLQNILTDCDNVMPLNEGDIDDLCEQLNSVQAETLR